MSTAKLSICLTVYNQLELVKENLMRMICYDGDDVEFLVSDDMSSEPIEDMVKSLADKRVRYIRGTENLGHDLNILQALENSAAQYVMVLRSRDTVYPEQISRVLEVINNNKEAAYYVFAADDENGNAKLRFSDKRYAMGEEAARAHTKLFVHPSGNLYNKAYLSSEIINELRNVIRSSFSGNYGFVVHDLIRMYLAEQGCFITSNEVVWEYTNTTKAQDIAVNSTKNKESVYAPVYEYPRYRCEFNFVTKQFCGTCRMIFFEYIIRRFYKSVTLDFALSNKDVKLQQHYNYKSIEHHPQEERKKFRAITRDLYSNLGKSEKMGIEIVIMKQTILHYLYYPIKQQMLLILNDSKVLAYIAKRVNRL